MERAFICFTFAFSAILANKTDMAVCVSSDTVCMDLIRNEDNITGKNPHCVCNNTHNLPCNDNWEDNSRSTLTWQDQERSRWTVQSKFCTPMIPERLCNGGERAAIAITDIEYPWNPRLDVAHCRCPNNRFQLDIWKKEDNQRKYFFSCEKSECGERQPCAKIIVNNNRTDYENVREVQLLCACPEGKKCLSDYRKYYHDNLTTEGQGATYVNEFCRDDNDTLVPGDDD